MVSKQQETFIVLKVSIVWLKDVKGIEKNSNRVTKHPF